MEEIDPTLFAKCKGGKKDVKIKDAEKQKDLAALEAQVYRFAEMLSEQRVGTKENVTRKQARTAVEKEESEEEDQPEESDDEEDNDIPYNPKNLPLGWDGKVEYILFYCYKFEFNNNY